MWRLAQSLGSPSTEKTIRETRKDMLQPTNAAIQNAERVAEQRVATKATAEHFEELGMLLKAGIDLIQRCLTEKNYSSNPPSFLSALRPLIGHLIEEL